MNQVILAAPAQYHHLLLNFALGSPCVSEPMLAVRIRASLRLRTGAMAARLNTSDIVYLLDNLSAYPQPHRSRRAHFPVQEGHFGVASREL